ncbi:PAS domain S-box protein [Streptomyces sp. ISL-1]|uniref:PAS domain S-box protein n=1 Tax=Streptomyces sp. ISL-1 TaxID=2817657 RepID=UPI0027E42A42|nr:PAS domain S-box protein [Streptomyces sp. ISL-1]
MLDDRGTVVGWSRRAQEVLGYPESAVIGRPAFDVLIDPGDLPAAKEAAATCRREGGWFGVLAVRHRSGRLVEMGFRAGELLRGDHVRDWLLVGAPAAEVLEWQRDGAVLDGLFRRCPIGLVVHSPEMTILRVNRAIGRFTGIPAASFQGMPTGALLVAEDARKSVERVRQVMDSGRSLVSTEQYARLERDPATGRQAHVGPPQTVFDVGVAHHPGHVRESPVGAGAPHPRTAAAAGGFAARVPAAQHRPLGAGSERSRHGRPLAVAPGAGRGHSREQV